jgi:hypothetical protein
MNVTESISNIQQERLISTEISKQETETTTQFKVHKFKQNVTKQKQ